MPAGRKRGVCDVPVTKRNDCRNHRLGSIVCPRMKGILTAALLGLAASARPLPHIELKPVLTKLADERPVWMSDLPDGS